MSVRRYHDFILNGTSFLGEFFHGNPLLFSWDLLTTRLDCQCIHLNFWVRASIRDNWFIATNWHAVERRRKCNSAFGKLPFLNKIRSHCHFHCIPSNVKFNVNNVQKKCCIVTDRTAMCSNCVGSSTSSCKSKVIEPSKVFLGEFFFTFQKWQVSNHQDVTTSSGSFCLAWCSSVGEEWVCYEWPDRFFHTKKEK